MSAIKFKVGITTILSIVLLFSGIFWVKNYNPTMKKLYMTVAFADGRAITGGDPVQISGIKVGEVTGVTLDPENRALVRFWMNYSTLHTDAQFTIIDVGLMGDKALVITPGSASGELDSDVIHNGVASPDLSVLIASAGTLLTRLENITADIDDNLNMQSLAAGFDSTLANFNEAIDLYATLAQDTRKPLNDTMENLHIASVGMEQFFSDNDNRLANAIDSFQTTSDRMSEFLYNIGNLPSVVDTLSYYVGSGNGTLGKLIKSDELYEEMRTTNATIDSFVVDFKRNPGKYTKDMNFKIRLF